MIAAYPLWWVLGLSGFMWAVLAVPMLASLTRRRGLVAPKGILIWVLFLIAVTGSVTSMMDGGIGRLSGWVLRYGYYIGATIYIFYLLNGRRNINVWRIVRPLTLLWMTTVIGGYLAFIIGAVKFKTPMAFVLPQVLVDNDLINSMVIPKFAEVQDIIGFPVPRPNAPWNHTNSWGSMLAILTPFAVIAMKERRVQVNQKLVRVLLVASVPPAIISLNRGLWLSLGLGVVYAAVRFGFAGDHRMVVRGFIGAVVLSIVLVSTPLGGLIITRFQTGHSNEDRTSLAVDAYEGALERPVFGWGGPRPNSRNLPSVGTHGQTWFTMFSYGFTGFFGYIGFMVVLAVRTFRQKTDAGLWAHVALVIGLLQLPYYLQVPQQMFALFAAAAIAIRLQSDDEIHLAFSQDLGGRKASTEAVPVAADDLVLQIV